MIRLGMMVKENNIKYILRIMYMGMKILRKRRSKERKRIMRKMSKRRKILRRIKV